MCFGNLSPIASRTSMSDLPTRSLAAANPPRSGTVSRSQTMTVGFIRLSMTHALWVGDRTELKLRRERSLRSVRAPGTALLGDSTLVAWYRSIYVLSARCWWCRLMKRWDLGGLGDLLGQQPVMQSQNISWPKPEK